MTSSWLTWLSPLGWGEQVRPFGDERWWALLLPLALLAGATLAAFAAAGLALFRRRDLAP